MGAITVSGSPELGRFNVIDDSNYLRYADDSSTKPMRRYDGRDYGKHPVGSMPFGAIPFPTYPEHEWQARIEEANAKKTFPIYHQLHRKVPILNQKRLPYCWAYAVCGAVQSIRACAGFENTVHLSATSFAAPGKNYREVGGWTGEAIGYANEFGISSIATWPEAVCDKRYFRESREEAKLYGVGQWFELRPRTIAEVVTCLLMGFPVTVGLMWWGHAIFYSGLAWDRGLKVIGDNSWGPDWENNGRTVLDVSKATPDEANCITSPRLDGDELTTKRFKSFYSTLSPGLAS